MKGPPHKPTLSSAPNRTTASMLSRPSVAQYTSSRLSQRANSSSVSAAAAPYSTAVSHESHGAECSLPVPSWTSQT